MQVAATAPDNLAMVALGTTQVEAAEKRVAAAKLEERRALQLLDEARQKIKVPLCASLRLSAPLCYTHSLFGAGRGETVVPLEAATQERLCYCWHRVPRLSQPGRRECSPDRSY